MLAGGLPPLGNGPRGSRVWCDSLPVGEARPLLGNGPRGSRKGQGLAIDRAKLLLSFLLDFE